MKPAIESKNLTVAYSNTPAIWDVNFALPPGSMTAIVGPNGAGKTSLLKALLGLIRPVAGEVFFHGVPFRRSNSTDIAYVPQRSSVDWDFPTTVFDVVLMGTYGKLGWFRRPGRAERETAQAALVQLGLADLADRQIGELSGGQQQRTFLARALAQQANILVLDEPFQGVDAVTESVIVQLLKEQRDRGQTLLVVHHDLSTVREYFDHAILLNQTVIAAGTIDDAFTKTNISRAFSKGRESTEFSIEDSNTPERLPVD